MASLEEGEIEANQCAGTVAMVDCFGCKSMAIFLVGGARMTVSAVTIVFLVGACSGSGTGVPAGAVELGKDLYMVPVGDGEGSCRMWRMHSPTMATIQVIHYRKSDGGFTVNKTEAGCRR